MFASKNLLDFRRTRLAHISTIARARKLDVPGVCQPLIVT
jgi:hypothetical protein